DAGDGETYETEGEEENADDVVFEVAPRGEPRGGIEERGKEDEEDDIGIHREVGCAGDEAKDQTGDHEDDWVGKFEFAGQGSKEDDEEQQQEEDNFDGVDGVLGH